MINTKRLLKVSSLWISIGYIICYAGVVIFPEIRNLYMKYALHTDATFGTNYVGIEYLVSGLIIWNIVTVIAVWLFAYLYNSIKK